MKNIEARYCRDGSYWIRTADSVFQVSEQQAEILRTIYKGERCGHKHHCYFEDFHAALWGHKSLTRGATKKRRAKKKAGTPLSASRRATLSRALKRLTEQGLIGKLHGLTNLTGVGLQIAKTIMHFDGPAAAASLGATLTGRLKQTPS
jgi:hypothetical protein